VDLPDLEEKTDMKRALMIGILAGMAFIAAAADDEAGFVPIFNGKDLTGWVGDTKGYVVENGSIVCKPGGNLFTDKDYADFVFRFEFKLTPAANNGIGIRVPIVEGNPSYMGMEIQVLDDRHPDYKSIEPWQAHGSVYGIVAAKRDHLKPCGEWNTEEILVQGRHVKVTLNGTVIVDADLDKATENGPIDHKDHPGLKNETGRIGFLGHGSVVEFRNLRVKDLKK